MHWTSQNAPAQGFVAPGFESVAEEFSRNFTTRLDLGAAFSATHNGRCVVDLWGGNSAPGRPWGEDTLQVIFSGTKGLMAACVLKLIELNHLDLNEPVAHYWPEFAQHGKDRVLVRHLVSHATGLPGISRKLTAPELTNFEEMENLLAREPLARDPNAYHCYHALSIGWMVGALVRRIDGRTIGKFFSEEFAVPLALDAYIGLPPELESRVGRLELGSDMVPYDKWSAAIRQDPTCLSIWGNPPLFPADLPWNTGAYHAAEIVAAGGIASARAMARFYGCMAMGGSLEGVQVLRPETVNLGRSELARFMDPYIAEAMVFGVCWALQTPQMRFGPAHDAFGHSGAGGSIHGGWPSRSVGFSYTMNQMRSDPHDLRSRLCLERLFEIIE